MKKRKLFLLLLTAVFLTVSVLPAAAAAAPAQNEDAASALRAGQDEASGAGPGTSDDAAAPDPEEDGAGEDISTGSSAPDAGSGEPPQADGPDSPGEEENVPKPGTPGEDTSSGDAPETGDPQPPAVPPAGDQSGLQIHVTAPSELAGKADIWVLKGESITLTATYNGTPAPPEGLQFCWQYSTIDQPHNFQYLTINELSTEHRTGAQYKFAASGTIYYRCVLDNADHRAPADYRASNVIMVQTVEFEFRRPAADQTVSTIPGESVILGPVEAVTTKEEAEISYQWQRQDGTTWNNISGADGLTFETGDLGSGTYKYRCVASASLLSGNLGGSGLSVITSPVYTIRVEPLDLSGYTLKIDGNEVPVPAGGTVTVPAGANVEISAVLTYAADEVSYRWQYAQPSGSWYELAAGSGVWGYRSARLTIPASSGVNGCRYRCQVAAGDLILGTGPDDPVITIRVENPADAYTAVRPDPWITSNLPYAGTKVEASAGMNVQFTAVNHSDPPIPDAYLAYQWESAKASGTFAAMAGETARTLVVGAKAGAEPVYYRCRVRNTASSGGLETVSNPLELTVKRPVGTVYFTEPQTDPEPAQALAGSSITFVTLAKTDDASPVTYQWQSVRVSAGTAVSQIPESSWTAIAGAQDADLTVPSLETGHYFYRCMAVNAANKMYYACSPVFPLDVVSVSTIPVVEPSATRTGADGTLEDVIIPRGVVIGGTIALEVSASVPSQDAVDYTWYILMAGSPEPQILGDSHTNVLTLQAVPERYDGSRIFCQVTNREHPSRKANSASWYLSTWSSSLVPQILSAPDDIALFYDPGEPPQDPVLTVEARLSTEAVLEHRTSSGEWEESDAVKFLPAGGTSRVEGPSQTYSGTLELDRSSFELNGEYRVHVMNGSETWPRTAPSAYSAAFSIAIEVSGQPVITMNPSDTSARVGEEAVFTVYAQVRPGSAQLVYCWQLSTDGGVTFANCLKEDGIQRDNTFTTAVLTEEMRLSDKRPAYRCIVANAATGQSITSTPAVLTVTEPAPPPVTADPELFLMDGSGLWIEDEELCGLTVSKDGTPGSQVLRQFYCTEGYHVRLVDGSGKIVAGDTPVATGMNVELVSDQDSEEVPEALTVIVLGDVLGTGVMSIAQIVRIAKSINGQTPLLGAYLKAGDFNGSGIVTIADLVRAAKILNHTD